MKLRSLNNIYFSIILSILVLGLNTNVQSEGLHQNQTNTTNLEFNEIGIQESKLTEIQLTDTINQNRSV